MGAESTTERLAALIAPLIAVGGPGDLDADERGGGGPGLSHREIAELLNEADSERGGGGPGLSHREIFELLEEAEREPTSRESPHPSWTAAAVEEEFGVRVAGETTAPKR